MSQCPSRLIILVPGTEFGVPGQDDDNEVSRITTDRPYEPSGNIGENETFGTRKSRSIQEILSRPLACLTILFSLYTC